MVNIRCKCLFTPNRYDGDRDQEQAYAFLIIAYMLKSRIYAAGCSEPAPRCRRRTMARETSVSVRTPTRRLSVITSNRPLFSMLNLDMILYTLSSGLKTYSGDSGRITSSIL